MALRTACSGRLVHPVTYIAGWLQRTPQAPLSIDNALVWGQLQEGSGRVADHRVLGYFSQTCQLVLST